jgi:hypothetical protein
MKQRRFSKNETFDLLLFFSLKKNQNDVVSLPMLTDLTNRLPIDLTDIFKNIVCRNEVGELIDKVG